MREQILLEPTKFNMNDFHVKSACGTSTSCICGYLNLNDDHRSEYDPSSISYGDTCHAISLIGLEDCDVHEDPDAIFFDGDWPSPFKEDYRKVEHNPQARAHVAADFIQYLINGGSY